MAVAGVPIFLAERVPVDGVWDAKRGAKGYRLPSKWEQTVADPAVLDRWRPGMAVCAVMGHLVDGADVDPRHGGTETHHGMVGAGMWPRSYGRQATPSGGWHDLISTLDVASRDALRPGLDLKAGEAGGGGRGFLFLAPTVALSKVTGELGEYRWSTEPDLTDLINGEVDDTGEALAEMVKVARSPTQVVALPATDGGGGAGYTGPSYKQMGPTDQLRAGAFAELALGRALDDLRAAQAWPVGHRDGLGRGWEKLTADKAQSLQTMLAEGWSGLDLVEVGRRFLEAAPTDASWTARDVGAKWSSQGSKMAVGGGRITFPRPPGREDGAEAADGLATVPPLVEPPEAGWAARGAIDWAKFLDTEDTEPTFLAGALAEEGEQVALVGEAKVGKSLLALDMAVAIAAGRPFLGDTAHEPLSVLYVDQENTPRDLRRRIRSLGYGLETLSGLHYRSFANYPRLDTMSGGNALIEVVDHVGARVVFLDTISRMISGKENDSDTWLAVYACTLARLKGRGVAVIRLDHFGKDADRGARGSSAKEQDVDRVWELRSAGKNSLRLKRTHSRTGLGDDLMSITRTGASGEEGTTRHLRDGRNCGELLDPGVANAVRQLAEAGCPPGLGRDRLKAWSREHKVGLLLRDAVWGQVVKARQ